MFSRFLAPTLLALAFVGGCAHQNSVAPPPAQKPADVGSVAPPPAQKPVDVGLARFPDDDLGRPTHLKAPAKRVVMIGPGGVEIMYALGADSQLVGRDDFSNYPLAAKSVAIGGNFQGPNVEQCIALRPDLVIVQGETWNKVRVDDWQTKIGVPVAALTTTNFRSLASDIRKLGLWVGNTPQAEAMAKNFEIPLPKTTGTALIETGDTGDWIAGKNTLVSDTAAHAGLKNIADDLNIEGYKQINLESLLVHPPDVIIVPSTKPKEQVLASLRTNAALAKLPCLQKGRVLVVNGDLLLRPGPRLLQGVTELKKQSDELNRR